MFGGLVSTSVKLKVSGFKFGRWIEYHVCNDCGHINVALGKHPHICVDDKMPQWRHQNLSIDEELPCKRGDNKRGHQNLSIDEELPCKREGDNKRGHQNLSIDEELPCKREGDNKRRNTTIARVYSEDNSWLFPVRQLRNRFPLPKRLLQPEECTHYKLKMAS